MRGFIQAVKPKAAAGAALACLWIVLLWNMTPPAVRVIFPPQQTVFTLHDQVGVHTRLTDEVEEWKIQKTLSLVREMGASWIVEYFPWAYIEPKPGQYQWDHSDLVLAHARNQGLTVIARLGMVPEWARLAADGMESTFTYLPSEHYADFASFAAAFAARYRDSVHHIIIWNEPNLSFEWGYRPVDAVAYTTLLAAVYDQAHLANPDVLILAGALAPTLEPAGSPNGLNDLLYLDGMYQAGASRYFDALAAHAYGLAFAPETAPSPELLNFRRVELLHQLMDAYGDGDKPIYVTEAGWNDHPRWTWAVTPSQRVAYTLTAYQWAEDNWPWCPVVAMWMFRTPIAGHNYQDSYAFVTPDFQLRPVYSAVQLVTGNAPRE